MAVSSQNEQGKGVNGTDYDSYKDQTTDTLVLLFAWWPWFARLISQYTGFIPFHNYRQWHIFQNALVFGWNDGAIKKGILPAIPECPILWQDIKHYWSFGGFLGIITYEIVAYIRVVIILVLLTLLAHWGNITPEDAAKAALTQIGVVL